MTELAVFDCDGTLVDSQRRIIDAVRGAWAEAQMTPPEDEAIRRIVGLALPQALQKLAPDTDAAGLARLVDGFRATFHAQESNPAYDEPLYEGALDALTALRDGGVTLVVATGKGQRGLRKTLTVHGILDWFAVLKTADDGPSKPHPQILEDAMLEVGASPATTVMIGDTAYDMAMARSAGAHCLGVAWGYHAPADLEAYGATRVIHRYTEAPGAVRTFLDSAQ
jgi:phosphoglycolate phosphatase